MRTDAVIMEKERKPIKADIEKWGFCPECKNQWDLYEVMSHSFVICDKCKTTHFDWNIEYYQWTNEDFRAWPKILKKYNDCKWVSRYWPGPDFEQIELNFGRLKFKCECIREGCNWFYSNKCHIESWLRKIGDDIESDIGKIASDEQKLETSSTPDKYDLDDDLPF